MESSVRSRLTKFKQLRHFTAVSTLALGLAACAGAPLRQAAPKAPAASQPLAHLVVVTPDAEHDLLAQLLAGEMALSQNDLKSASSYYGKAMALSADAEVAERAAKLAIATHDSAGAESALDRWQALGGKPAQMAQARAELALNRGDADEAKHQLELLIHSGDKDAWRKFGRVLVGARDQAQAARLLEALATAQQLPDDPQAWLAMSQLGDKFGSQAYAATIAEAAVQRFGSVETYAWAAQLKARQGDQAGARALLRKALHQAPKNIHLRLVYASMLGQAGDYAGAARLLRRGPQNVETFAMRVGLAAHEKDAKALTSLYQELQQAPRKTRENSAYLLGQLAESQHQGAEALTWYERVADDDPHAFDADLRSAVILYGQGEKAAAHQLLELLQSDYVGQPEQLRQAWQADAELYLSDQDYAQAEHVFSQALQALPNDPGLLYGRGLTYAEAGQIDLAVRDFKQLLKIKPGDVEASNALGYTLADANRDLSEAERLLRVARTAKPNDPAIADSWGWLLYRKGELKRAAKTLRGSWLARKDAEVGVHLGEVLWALGNKQKANKVFDEVRKLDPHSASLQKTLQRLHP